jgi:hypothetical protein
MKATTSSDEELPVARVSFGYWRVWAVFFWAIAYLGSLYGTGAFLDGRNVNFGRWFFVWMFTFALNPVAWLAVYFSSRPAGSRLICPHCGDHGDAHKLANFARLPVHGAIKCLVCGHEFLKPRLF